MKFAEARTGMLARVDDRAHPNDREVGRIVLVQHILDGQTVELVTLRVTHVGDVVLSPEQLTPWGYTPRPGGEPYPGCMVEICAAFPDLGVARGQLGRVVDVGPIPPKAARIHNVAPGTKGYLVTTVGNAGRVRGWLTPYQVHRLG